MWWTITYMIKNKTAFTENPLIYGAKKLENVDCNCKKVMEDGEIVKFYFNDTGIWEEPKIENINQLKYNPNITVNWSIIK